MFLFEVCGGTVFKRLTGLIFYIELLQNNTILNVFILVFLRRTLLEVEVVTVWDKYELNFFPNRNRKFHSLIRNLDGVVPTSIVLFFLTLILTDCERSVNLTTSESRSSTVVLSFIEKIIMLESGIIKNILIV